MSAEKKKASQPASHGEEDENLPTGPEILEDGSETPQNQMDNEEMALEEPQITIKDYQDLQDELEKARVQTAENFEGWQRERADFMNYKRRIERDQFQSAQNMTGSIIKRFLPFVDDLDRALKNRPAAGEDATAWENGIELIDRKLHSILESEGVQPIQAEGEMFDPNFMEAITHEDSPDHESGQVIEIIQQGYMLGDRVLRPALVRVAR